MSKTNFEFQNKKKKLESTGGTKVVMGIYLFTKFI